MPSVAMSSAARAKNVMTSELRRWSCSLSRTMSFIVLTFSITSAGFVSRMTRRTAAITRSDDDGHRVHVLDPRRQIKLGTGRLVRSVVAYVSDNADDLEAVAVGCKA